VRPWVQFQVQKRKGTKRKGKKDIFQRHKSNHYLVFTNTLISLVPLLEYELDWIRIPLRSLLVAGTWNTICTLLINICFIYMFQVRCYFYFVIWTQSFDKCPLRQNVPNYKQIISSRLCSDFLILHRKKNYTWISIFYLWNLFSLSPTHSLNT
jgi:hypothetical protein